MKTTRKKKHHNGPIGGDDTPIISQTSLNADGKSVDSKSVDGKSVDSKSVDGKSVDGKGLTERANAIRSSISKSASAVNASVAQRVNALSSGIGMGASVFGINVSNLIKTNKGILNSLKTSVAETSDAGSSTKAELVDAMILYAKKNKIIDDAPEKSIRDYYLPSTDSPSELIPNKNEKHKTEITVILPFLLQTYESLYTDENHKGTTQLKDKNRTKVPNREIMEVVIREIQKIQQHHPHPQLFESIFYFWNIFNLQTALSIMMAYLNAVPDGKEPSSHPGDIITVVEKQLGNTESFRDWDTSMTKKPKFHVYTTITGQKYNPIAHANSTLIALTQHPFGTYNPLISRRAIETVINPRTGQFEKSTQDNRNNIYKLPPRTPPVSSGGRRTRKSRFSRNTKSRMKKIGKR